MNEKEIKQAIKEYAIENGFEDLSNKYERRIYMRDIIIFPSKNQWNLCTHLKYWWLKLLRRKPTVCDGVDDQKEIQNAMDNTDESGVVIVLARGEYNMKEILLLPNFNV